METTQVATNNYDSKDFSEGTISGRGRNSLQALSKSKCSLNFVVIKVRTLSKKRPLDPTSMITLRSSDTTSFFRFTPQSSGDPVLNARCQAGVEIALSMRVERALLDPSPQLVGRFCTWR